MADEIVRRSHRRARLTGVFALLGASALALAFRGAWAMARRPELYADGWYAKGGARRTVQILATDVLGPTVAGGLAVGFSIGALLSLALVVATLTRARALRLAEVRPRALLVLGALVAVSGWLLALRAGDERAIPKPSLFARDAPPPSAPGRPNLVIIAARGLRFDRLTPRTMPHLSEWSRTATRFDQAFVSLPVPALSWATWLSGQARASASPSKPSRTLLDRFEAAGYRVLSPPSDDPSAPSLDVAAGAIARLDEALSDPSRAPFVMTLALSSTMPPLVSPPSDRALFADRSYRGPFKYAVPRLDPGAQRSPPEPSDLPPWNALFDAAAHADDRAIARVLDALASRGLSEHTIVVVLGTHGEVPFGVLPSGDPGDDLVHVPLVVRVPGRAPHVASEVVRDVDLAPTLYELAGLPVPAELDGASLVPAIEGRALSARVAVSTLATSRERDESLVWATRTARDDRFTLVHRPSRQGVECTVLERGADVSRAKDVSAQVPEDARRLREALSLSVLRDPGLREVGGRFLPRTVSPEGVRHVVWIDVLGNDLPIHAREKLGGALFPRMYEVTLFDEEAKLGAMLSGARPHDGAANERVAASLPRLLRAHGYVVRAFASPARRASLAALSNGELGDVLSLEVLRSSQDPAARPETSGEPSFTWVALGASDGAALDDLLARFTAHSFLAGALVIVTGRPSPVVVSSPAVLGSRPRGASLEQVLRGSLLLLGPGRDTTPPRKVDARMEITDIVPTVTEVLGVRGDPQVTGRSLLRLARGETEPYERAVWAQGRAWGRGARGKASRTSLATFVRGPYRYVTACPSEDPSEECRAERLYDLSSDGLVDRSLLEPGVTGELRARLRAARANVPIPGESPDPHDDDVWRVRLRFSGGRHPHRVSGTLSVGSSANRELRSASNSVRILRAGVGAEAVRVRGAELDVAFVTSPRELVGFDLELARRDLPLRWTFFLDDAPWPADAVFAGPHGVPSPELMGGLASPEVMAALEGPGSPEVDPRSTPGLFVLPLESVGTVSVGPGLDVPRNAPP